MLGIRGIRYFTEIGEIEREHDSAMRFTIDHEWTGTLEDVAEVVWSSFDHKSLFEYLLTTQRPHDWQRIDLQRFVAEVSPVVVGQVIPHILTERTFLCTSGIDLLLRKIAMYQLAITIKSSHR